MSVSILTTEKRLAAHARWALHLDCFEDCWRHMLSCESFEGRKYWYQLAMKQYDDGRKAWRIWQGIA